MSEDTQTKTISAYIKTEKSLASFADILGGVREAYSYIANVLLVVKADDRLSACTNESIFTSAIRAASLQLSVDPGLGLAYLVAYKDKCTLLIGYKGLYDLAMRTEKYRFINVDKVYEGEEWIPDRLTGLHKLGGEGKKSDKVIGWFGYFQLRSEYQKTIYMSVEEIHAHGKRYSPSYKKMHPQSLWLLNPEAMEYKTAMRQLLKWGVFEPNVKAQLDALDEEQGEIIDTKFTESEPPKLEGRIEADVTTGEITEKEKKPVKKKTTAKTKAKKNNDAPKPWDEKHVELILSVTDLISKEAANELLEKSGMSKHASLPAIKKWGSSYAAAIVRGDDIPTAIAHAKKYWQDFGEVNKNETASENN